MKGYIIYNEEEAKKNSSFIEKFQNEGTKYDINFQYIPYEEYRRYEEPDLVINRTRDYRVSRYYENNGITVFNPAYLIHIGNNKYEATGYLSEHLSYEVKDNKWIANTWFIGKNELNAFIDDEYMGRLISNLTGSADNDVIIKSVDGHGGSEVFLLENGVNNLGKRREILERLSGHDCVVQERIDSDSSDIRVYIIGGKIYAAVLRHGENDFRSNYSLGGNVKEYKLDDYQESYVMKFVEALGGSKIGMAGIDFILAKDGSLVFNEIEEMAGSRMLYECTDYDIVKDYVQWISKFI